MIPPVEEKYKLRFWSKVQTGSATDCWPFLGGAEVKGKASEKAAYGLFYMGKDLQMVLAHRCAYAFTHGEVPDGVPLMHSCDNSKCCNPAHLEQGSHAENMKQRALKLRTNGVKLTMEQAVEVKKLRDAGVPGHEVAEKFGVSQQTICDIFKGRIRRWATMGHA